MSELNEYINIYQKLYEEFELNKKINDIHLISFNDIMKYACKNGNLELVKYLHTIQNEGNKEYLYASNNFGHLHLIKYFTEFEDFNDKTIDQCFNFASYYGNVDILKYLHTIRNDEESNIEAYKTATKNKKLNSLIYLNGHINDREVIGKAFINSAGLNDVKTVKHFYSFMTQHYKLKALKEASFPDYYYDVLDFLMEQVTMN